MTNYNLPFCHRLGFGIVAVQPSLESAEMQARFGLGTILEADRP